MSKQINKKKGHSSVTPTEMEVDSVFAEDDIDEIDSDDSDDL